LSMYMAHCEVQGLIVVGFQNRFHAPQRFRRCVAGWLRSRHSKAGAERDKLNISGIGAAASDG